MANQYKNKIVVGGQVLIDLTEDTVTPEQLQKGVTAHDKSGAPIEGSCTYDADTRDADVNEGEILAGKSAYKGGKKVTGIMPNNEGNNVEVSDLDGTSIPAGYYDGSGKAKVSDAEAAKLIPGNIREGITILGVTGTHEGESHVEAETVEVTSSFEEQTVNPSEGKYISDVKVKPIPVSYVDNEAGGQTVTVG